MRHILTAAALLAVAVLVFGSYGVRSSRLAENSELTNANGSEDSGSSRVPETSSKVTASRGGEYLPATRDAISKMLGFESFDSLQETIEQGGFKSDIEEALENPSFLESIARTSSQLNSEHLHRERTSLDFGESIYSGKWEPLLADFPLSDADRIALRESLIHYEARVDELHRLEASGDLQSDALYSNLSAEQSHLESMLRDKFSAEELELLSRRLNDYRTQDSQQRDSYWETRASQGYTSLMLSASQENSVNELEALVAAGAQVDARDSVRGANALINATENGRISNIHALIDLGASIDLGDSRGNTALFYAISQGQLEIVQLLVDAGADTHHRNNLGFTAIDRARLMKYDSAAHGEVLKLLESL